MKDGEAVRRLLGWPQEWPDDPEKGHFAMIEAEWLIAEDGEYRREPVNANELILIPASTVQMVEFLKSEADQGEGDGRHVEEDQNGDESDE